MPAAALHKLPNELLVQICNNIISTGPPETTATPLFSSSDGGDDDESQDYTPVQEIIRTLACLCLTCKRLNHVATPFLYRTFVEPALGKSQCLRFMATLSKRRDLAHHIKKAFFWDGFDLSATQASELTEIFGTLPLVKHARVPPELSESFVRKTSRHGTLVGIFLSLASNLEYVSLPCTFVEFGAHMLPDTTLPSLKLLDLRRRTIEWGFHLNTVESLLQRAPVVESLRIEFCWSIPRGLKLGNLTSLHFVNAFLIECDVETVAKACPQLQRFTFQYYHTRSSVHDFCLPGASRLGLIPLLPKDIAKELLPCKQTLQYLKIDLSKWPNMTFIRYMDSIQDEVRDLKPFASLKELHLDGFCLYRPHDDFREDYIADEIIDNVLINMLPDYIETLNLFNIHCEFYAPIVELARQARSGEKFPHLTNFRVCIHDLQWANFESHSAFEQDFYQREAAHTEYSPGLRNMNSCGCPILRQDDGEDEIRDTPGATFIMRDR